MSVIPTGHPYFTRAAGHANYGGHVDKRNHLSQGVIDPETDVSAQQLARLATDLASIARVAPFAYMVVQCNDTSPAAPTVVLANMGTGISSAGYEGDAPPSGFPTLARVSDGRFTITFDSTYTDDYGVSGSFIVQPGMGNVISAAESSITIIRTSATVLNYYLWDGAGAALDDGRCCFTVYSGGA
jgi:hypothetical protein